MSEKVGCRILNAVARRSGFGAIEPSGARLPNAYFGRGARSSPSRKGGPILVVADRGPGIPWDEKKNVMKRFYRLERSRHRPGSGLGLSLVEAVAQLHDTRIELLDNAPGLKVELHFPSAATTRSVADLHDLGPAAARR